MCVHGVTRQCLHVIHEIYLWGMQQALMSMNKAILCGVLKVNKQKSAGVYVFIHISGSDDTVQELCLVSKENSHYNQCKGRGFHKLGAGQYILFKEFFYRTTTLE